MASAADAEEVLRSTKEKENFQRLTSLLMCGGVRLLRDKFDSFHSPTNLPLKLGDPATQAQLKKAKTSKPEWDCLYPSAGTFGKSTDFDITLTFRLLRTICSLTPPPLTGWNDLPNSADRSLEADLVRIKCYRNSVYGHNQKMEITDSEFCHLWKEISEALLRIAGTISQAKKDEWKKSINELLHDPLTTEAQRYVDELQLWYKNDMEVKDAVEQVRDQLHQVSMEVRDQQQVNVDIRDQLQQVSMEVRDQNNLIQQVNQKLDVVICIAVESFSQNGQLISSSQFPVAPGLQVATGSGRMVTVPMQREQPQSGGSEVTTGVQDPPTELDIWTVILSFKDSFNLFLEYLRVRLGVGIASHDVGSLLITVTCSSLQILEELWEDYHSGHLNKEAEQKLVTAQVLEKLHLSAVNLKTTITKKEYQKCKEFFLGSNQNYETVGITDSTARAQGGQQKAREKIDTRMRELRHTESYLEEMERRDREEMEVFREQMELYREQMERDCELMERDHEDMERYLEEMKRDRQEMEHDRQEAQREIQERTRVEDDEQRRELDRQKLTTNMAGTKRTAERKGIHVFNCDNLCSLSEVESLLNAVEKNVAFKISKVVKHKFRGGEIAGLVEKTIPNLKGIDYAVFFVHAHESSLAFSEDSGYGKIYEALAKRIGSGEKVLIVIGGDDSYKDKDEEDRCFLSRWAKKKAISCQFRTEFLDGRKSFIFSWNKKHRPIHEEALLHYFDPSKKGQKFEYQPKPKPLVVPETEESKITPLTVVDIQEGEPEEEPESSQQEPTSNEEETVDSWVDEQDGGRVPSDEIEESEMQVSSEGSQVSSPSGSLMLETLLRYGKISFDTKDVVTWDGSWRPSESEEEELEQDWKSTAVANLKIFVDENGKIQDVVVEPTKSTWTCSIS